jgi:Flp pilus assembly pilin Flp
MMTLLDMVSLRRDRGQGMLEYALIILFVMLVVFGGLFLVGPAVKSSLDSVLPAL